MRIFLVCKTWGVTEEEIAVQRAYVEFLENRGDIVYWPRRDTKQNDPEHGTEICRTAFWHILWAKEVHFIFDPTSQGFVADIMLTFALNELGTSLPFRRLIKRRRVIIVNPEVVDRMIEEEMEEQISQGMDPLFAKSYTMVLKNLAEETAHL